MNSNNISTNENITNNTNQFNNPIKIDEYLAELAVPDLSERRISLCNILTRNNLDYTVQKVDSTLEKPLGVENYLVKIGPDQDPHLLFCAHYDAFPASCGANDNSAAVCILIELAKELKKINTISAEFAFFDGEESNHSGSKLFVNELNSNQISAVINLDICGYGDTITIYSHGSTNKPSILSFCDKKILAHHNGQLVKYLPESDDISFNGSHIPTLNVAIMPKWDAHCLKTLATYNDNILGKPPEFELILGQMEVITTMHGGFRDKVSTVQPMAMHQVYDYLFESITSFIPNKKLFHFF